jgi:FtsZ-interacting cell division protein ZipA
MSAPSHKKGCTKSICVRGCTVEAARQLLLTGKRKQLDHGKKKENKKRRKKEDKDDEDGEEQEEEQEEEQGSEENSRRLLHAPSTFGTAFEAPSKKQKSVHPFTATTATTATCSATTTTASTPTTTPLMPEGEGRCNATIINLLPPLHSNT